MLMVAPNGGRHGREWHAAIPLAAAELAADAVACAAAGASALHCHVRDAEGRHSLDVGLYHEWLAAVRRAAGDRLLLQVTTEAVGIYRPEAQMACVRALRPEAVSLALRELLPEGADPAPFRDFLLWLVAERISPQFILYDPDDVARLERLRQGGTIPQRAPLALFVLGRYLAPASRWRRRRCSTSSPGTTRPAPGRSAPSAGPRRRASPRRRPWAGTSGSGSRTTGSASTAASPPATPSGSRRSQRSSGRSAGGRRRPRRRG
jgi:hypothetical protein